MLVNQASLPQHKAKAAAIFLFKLSNMKKIVIAVHMKSEKCRRKALKIAAVAQGVNSVSLEGENRDQVVVIGNGINSVRLTMQLRKKFRHVVLTSVEEAAPPIEEVQNEMMPMENLSVPYDYYSKYPSPSPCPAYHVVRGGSKIREQEV